MANEENLEDIFEEKSSEDASDEVDALFADLDDSAGSSLVSADSGVVVLDGAKYAISLNWKDAIGDSSGISKEAKIAAKNEAQFFCTPTSGEAQYGLGYSNRGHKAGMPSLAAAIQDNLGDNWAAAFKIGSGYYIAIARDGLIHPDFDSLFQSEAEAQEAFSSVLSEPWERIIAPQDWNIHDAEASVISDLELSPKLHRLRSANPAKILVRLGIAVLVISALGVGAKLVKDYLDEKQVEVMRELREAQARNEAVNKVVKTIETTVEPILGIDIPDAEIVEKPPRPPWLGKRNGVGELIVCPEDVEKHWISVPGWTTNSLSCNSGNVGISLSQDGGTIGWAEAYLRKNGYPNIDLSQSVGSGGIYLNKRASFVSEYAPNLNTQPLEEVGTYLKRHFAELRFPIYWEERSVNPENIVDRYYRMADFRFETAFSPSDFTEMFSKVKAFEISNINFNVQSSTWQVQGTVFQKRDTPLPRPQSQ